MRTNLVTNFHCTDCGGILNLSYAPNDGVRPDWKGENITGARKVESRIWIEPCRKCVGEARRPLKLLKEAIASVGE